MKFIITSAIVVLATTFAGAAEVGKPAPAFSVKNAKGETVSLADFKDKVVIVEWNNFGCPFVKKYYSSDNMQKLQETYVDKGVVWLTVGSESDAAKTAEQKWKGSHYLIDEGGKLAKEFGAKTTPHMFVISKEGNLVYSGAIDSKATTEVADIETAENYVVAAADAALEGKEVAKAKTEPYGCAVK